MLSMRLISPHVMSVSYGQTDKHVVLRLHQICKIGISYRNTILQALYAEFWELYYILWHK